MIPAFIHHHTRVPLIGREQELATLCRWLTVEEAALVTLTGPPGVGKTTLAAHVAQMLVPTFPEGIAFTSLASVSEATHVASSIAHVLGLSDPQHLNAHLAQKQILLILDTFEQVIGASSVVSSLMQQCPRLRILVTSRERLRLRGERVFLLSPLLMPDVSIFSSLSSLANTAALSLFLARVQAARPDFQLTDDNAATLVEICRRLDGLPLALELAAEHLLFLTPSGLLARLSLSFDVLTLGPRDLPRHQTLANALAWSYTLLSAQEQWLFRQLAVFVGGCTIDAVEHVCSRVCAARGLPSAPVLCILHALRDKSLLMVQGEREPRLAMLQIIRDYAFSQLKHDQDFERACEAHAACYLDLAEQIMNASGDGEEQTWFEKLEAERLNLRAALSWYLNRAQPTPALRLCHALVPFWMVRGYAREGFHWLQQTLALPGSSPLDLRASVLERAGMMAFRLGNYPTALEYTKLSLTLFERLLDPRGQALALLCQGNIATFTMNIPIASESLAQAFSRFEQLGDEKQMAYTLMALGNLSRMQGESTQAGSLFQKSYLLFARIHAREGAAWSRYFLGWHLLEQGEATHAYQIGAECLAFFSTFFNKDGIGQSLGLMGHALLEQRRLPRAISLLEKSVTLLEGVSNRWGTACSLLALAQARVLLGEDTPGLNLYRQSLELFLALHDMHGIASTLLGASSIFVLQHDTELATFLWNASEHLRQATGLKFSPREMTLSHRLLALIRQNLQERTSTHQETTGPVLHDGPESSNGSNASPARRPTNQKRKKAERREKETHVLLTGRELEVLRLLAEGLTNDELASRLVVSPHTINTHLSSIYSKLAVSSRLAAVRWAQEHHLI